MLEPDPNLTTPKRCSSPFAPSSGCTVVTKELVHEAELAIRSFQTHHNNVPVYVFCDGYTKQALLAKNFSGNVVLFERELKIPESVKKHNEYHRTDAILWKMDVFHLAIQRSGDSVFFDADILFLAPITGPEDCEVALSHNLPSLPIDHDGHLHGFFNAGLVWTCNPKFAGWWKHQYLNMGGFYEQVGMNKAPRFFRCGYFDYCHNYGFWRGSMGNRNPKSVHLHLSTALDHKMPEFMSKLVRSMRKEVWRYLFNNKEYKDVATAARKIIKHPDKVLFAHFGKAAGVYVNEILKYEIIPDYVHHDSWEQLLGRDWTPEELDFILTEADPLFNHYIHQHHISISLPQIEVAKKQGWKTVMFLRHPLEIITSLFYWRAKTIAESSIDWPLGQPNRKMNLQEFWYELLDNPDYKKLWVLPKYTYLLDEVKEFSDDNLANITNKWFGYRAAPRAKMNVSNNPGYKSLIDSGDITPSMIRDIATREEYKEFGKYVNLQNIE